MSNELKQICDRLEGWSTDKIRWLVIKAEQNEDGTWELRVIKKEEPEEKNENNK